MKQIVVASSIDFSPDKDGNEHEYRLASKRIRRTDSERTAFVHRALHQRRRVLSVHLLVAGYVAWSDAGDHGCDGISRTPAQAQTDLDHLHPLVIEITDETLLEDPRHLSRAASIDRANRRGLEPTEISAAGILHWLAGAVPRLLLHPLASIDVGASIHPGGDLHRTADRLLRSRHLGHVGLHQSVDPTVALTLDVLRHLASSPSSLRRGRVPLVDSGVSHRSTVECTGSGESRARART